MADSRTLKLVSTVLTSNTQGYTNAAFVHPEELKQIAKLADLDYDAVKDKGVLCAVSEAVLFVRQADSFKPGTIGVGMLQRIAGSMPLNSGILVTPFKPPRGNFPMATAVFEVDQLQKAATQEITVDAADLATFLGRTYHGHVFNIGQSFAALFEEAIPLKLTVRGFEYLDVTGKGENAEAGGAAAFGQFLQATAVEIRRAASAVSLKLTGTAKKQGSQLFSKGFNFEALGIGGLNKEFADIFRRAFASRVVPPEVLKRMGQHHVRGMLLYGPPGCGKTLIARQIGKALHSRPPKIVNGPEILNKYVGQSEENIRNLFADAEKEQAERGDDSDLHIIIFDEIDAITKQRGTVGGGTGVNDSVVNQLLSKIDGVEALNNILLIGMTNRKDLIDEAVLRPGRLEVHVEIGLPDEVGRTQIFNIHTAEMRANSFLGDDVSIEELAAKTKNYTGAEIEAVVKAAASFVFARQVDVSDLTKTGNFKDVKVTRDDFERALRDVQPAFGMKEDELKDCFANGIISLGEEFESTVDSIRNVMHQVLQSARSSLISVVLTGSAGSGKTALATKLAVESGFPFVKRISAQSLLHLHENGKSDAIVRVFNDAYKSPQSLIILDDIERLIEFVPIGPRFNNQVLQTLLVLVKAKPPQGHRLLVIGTTANPGPLEQMELMSAFELSLNMSLVRDRSQYESVFRTYFADDTEIRMAADNMDGTELGIKKLVTVLETAKAMADDAAVTYEHFLEARREWKI